LLIAEEEEANGETFILAGERYTTLMELLTIIGKTLQKDVRVLHIPVTPVYAASYVSEKACSMLKIKPFLYR
jgi:uncharacterized protein YbjT (DUF2867 family)